MPSAPSEPIFEADFEDSAYGRRRSAREAKVISDEPTNTD